MSRGFVAILLCSRLGQGTSDRVVKFAEVSKWCSSKLVDRMKPWLYRVFL